MAMKIQNVITQVAMLQVEYGNTPSKVYMHKVTIKDLSKELTYLAPEQANRAEVTVSKLHFSGFDLEVIPLDSMKPGVIRVE